MRIALVCPYDLALHGGVRSQVLGLARALSRAGEEVVVIGPGPLPGSLGEVHVEETVGIGRAEGVTLTTVGPSLKVAANGSLAPVALLPAAAVRTGRAIERWRPDVVHVHEPFAPLVGLVAAHGRGAPVLATFHRSGAGAGYRLGGPLFRVLFGRLDGATAVSAAARETLVEVLGDQARRTEIVPNGVDLERFSAPSVDSARPGIAGSGAEAEGDRRVVFVGRIERRKGLSVLLAAAAGLEARAQVVVVGDGPERAALESRHRDRPEIAFLGRLDDAQLAGALAGAALLVAPSLSGESFGVVLLEAMAAGVPVVCSDLPGYREAAGEAARYVPPGDEGALRRAIADLLASPAERRRLAALGRSRAAGFAFSVLAAAYLDRYRSLAARPTARGRSKRVGGAPGGS